MTTELYPNSELAATNVSGDVNDLRDNDTTAGYDVVDADSDWSARFAMDDPGVDLSGQQTVRVFMAPFNGNDPLVDIDLFEDGSFVQTLVVEHQLDSGEEEVTGTFSAGDVTDGDAVELQIAVERGGGMPGSRANADCRYVTWDAELSGFVDASTDSATSRERHQATLNGSIDWEGDMAEVWFEWGELGTGLPNATPAQTITETGTQSFDETITGLNLDTEYEVRAHADIDNGGVTDTGAVVTFWTLPEAPAPPSDLQGVFVDE